MVDENMISQVDFECAMIIAAKMSKGAAPFQADAHEVMSATGLKMDDVIGSMRYLARAGKFVAHISINKVPILTRL